MPPAGGGPAEPDACLVIDGSTALVVKRISFFLQPNVMGRRPSLAADKVVVRPVSGMLAESR